MILTQNTELLFKYLYLNSQAEESNTTEVRDMVIISPENNNFAINLKKQHDLAN